MEDARAVWNDSAAVRALALALGLTLVTGLAWMMHGLWSYARRHGLVWTEHGDVEADLRREDGDEC